MNGREDSHTYKHTRIQTHTQTESSGIEIAKRLLGKMDNAAREMK